VRSSKPWSCSLWLFRVYFTVILPPSAGGMAYGRGRTGPEIPSSRAAACCRGRRTRPVKRRQSSCDSEPSDGRLTCLRQAPVVFPWLHDVLTADCAAEPERIAIDDDEREGTHHSGSFGWFISLLIYLYEREVLLADLNEQYSYKGAGQPSLITEAFSRVFRTPPTAHDAVVRSAHQPRGACAPRRSHRAQSAPTICMSTTNG